jgi:hypothetical protein
MTLQPRKGAEIRRIGLSFPIPGVPGLSVTSEYRFFGVPGSESFAGTQVVAGLPAS